MLFITNKPPLTAMGDVLHDHDLAEAIVDRVLEPCVYQSTHIRMGVTSVPIDNRLCGENENCAPTPRASIDDMGGRRLAVVIIAPPIYTMAIKVAFDGLGALLVIEDGDHQISVGVDCLLFGATVSCQAKFRRPCADTRITELVYIHRDSEFMGHDVWPPPISV